MGMLDGVKVLDLSRLLPGPACTAWLLGQGARVDRVESTQGGDFTRHIPPYIDGVGAYFLATGRGKRSIAVDLRAEAGRALVRRMVVGYDVLVEGFRPGVLESMGLGPDVLHAQHPGLVIARLSGYGQTGPWADRVGHDINYMGLTGALSFQGRNDDGIVIPTAQVADMAGSMVAAAGIAAALYARERTGKGRVLDVSLTEAGLWTASPLLAGASGGEGDLGPGQHLLSGGLPVYGTYRCADGAWITVGALEPKFQALLAASTEGAVGRPELAEVFATRTRDAWVEALQDVCVAQVLAPSEVAQHPQIAARDAVRAGRATWVRPPLGDYPAEGTAPALGEHADVMLEEVGIGAAEREALRAQGVVL